MAPNVLDTTVLVGLQQIIEDKLKYFLNEKIAQRELNCLKKQLELSTARMAYLEKKVVNSNSFTKRYSVYKTEAEKVLKPEKAEEIRQKARTDAYEQQKAFVGKFDQERSEFQEEIDALKSKVTEEITALKKKTISAPTKKRPAGKKDPNAPKRSVIPSAYSRFVGDKKVKKQHEAAMAEEGSETEKNLFTYAGSVWKNMSEAEKLPYVTAQKADKAAKDARVAEEERAAAIAAAESAVDSAEDEPEHKPKKQKKGESDGESGHETEADDDDEAPEPEEDDEDSD